MERCAILADSSAPLIPPLAALLRSRGLSCLELAGMGEADPASPDTLRWNPPSLLSAHTAILEANTRYGGLSAGVLAFDADAFAANVAYEGVVDASAAVNTLVTGWIFLAESVFEALAKQGSGFLCFVHAAPPAKAENASLKPLPLPVAIAESAFLRLAEESARRHGERSLLVRYETGADDAQLEWLASRILEGPPSRATNRWHKAGSRGLFGIL